MPSRDNLRAAEHLLNQLLAQDSTEPDVAFEIKILDLDLMMRRGSYPEALEELERLSSRLVDEDADVYHRARLLTLKAQLLSKCGVPLKGFSVAIRAASVAWRARILPSLWEALATVANVLVHLREFEAAVKLMIAIIPQVFGTKTFISTDQQLTFYFKILECEDAASSAKSYSVLIDAQMGLAGLATRGTPRRKEYLTKTLEYIDRAFDGERRDISQLLHLLHAS